MIGMPYLDSKITAATTTVFFWRFSAIAEFFSGGFSVNAENIQLWQLNSAAWGLAPPQTPLGELTALPQTP